MPNPFKVIVVNDLAIPAGGSHGVAIDTCLALAEAGVPTHLLHGGFRVDARLVDNLEIARSRIPAEDVLQMGSLRGASNYLWSSNTYQSCQQAFARLRQQQECLVHIHSYSRRLSPAVFAAARQAGVPVVHTLHDYFAFSPNGLHYDFNRDVILGARDKPLRWLHRIDRRWSHHCLRSLRHVLCQRLKLLPDGVQHFVAVSQPSRTLAAQFLPADRISTIYSPVQKVSGKATPWKQRHLVFVGRISQEKGVLQLARAAAELDLPLRFVGDGPDAAGVRALNPQVEVTGWVDERQVQQEILQARALVLPSRWHETFGLCVAEALRVGVPTVVSRLAGSSAWVTHGEDGLLFDPYLEGGLQAALSRLSSASFVQSCSEHAWNNFHCRDTSREKYARELLSVYRQVLGIRLAEQEAAA